MTTAENPLNNARVAYEYYNYQELVRYSTFGNGLISKTYQITHTLKMKKTICITSH